MGYDQVMRLPLKAFWLMNGNVERIMAQKDMRSMTVAMISQASSEDATKYRQHLTVEAGTIVTLDRTDVVIAEIEELRDENGFAELKMMARV